ncbi:uncharacterized protein BYT42DRAFT_215121 [Radiomyces spectabilis]|uniref:uncharacterized protein n=1 Tax=Radiomyces spectabilis TaxID=64574 RepID=UPI002220AB30|nr:uncharacterized protein BYT42DRAFT_215121 [Radiomyces spectabilis]KAI8363967.1 hypothetical protein BYT42DRAFT_215121 [Radiomyces spectabilis]
MKEIRNLKASLASNRSNSNRRLVCFHCNQLGHKKFECLQRKSYQANRTNFPSNENTQNSGKDLERQ